MTMPTPTRRRLVATLASMPVAALAALALPTAVQAASAGFQPTDDPAASPVWQKIHATLFANRPITPATPEQLLLEAPARAADGAVVPVAIRSRLPQTAARYVRKLYLVIDANPSPVGAAIELGPDSGRVDIETRVRVDAYSHMRAIAETSDGQLFMSTRFVKASGGCSAPAGADAALAKASMGQMRWRIDGDLQGTAPVRAQLAINHPNDSGFAMDQATRQTIPAHYVRHIDVRYGGQPLLEADVDFSISENPNLRFYFVPKPGAQLQATVVDSEGKTFASTAPSAETAGGDPR